MSAAARKGTKMAGPAGPASAVSELAALVARFAEQARQATFARDAAIRVMVSSGASQRDAARAAGLSHTAVQAILRRAEPSA